MAGGYRRSQTPTLPIRTELWPRNALYGRFGPNLDTEGAPLSPSAELAYLIWRHIPATTAARTNASATDSHAIR